MSILLTHGYFLHEDPKEQEIMRPYPTLGLLYVSGYLNEKGMEHEVFDTTFSSKEELINRLLDRPPEVVAFYTNLMTKVTILEFVQMIKRTERLQNTKIVLGGPDLSYNQENYLKSGADFLVIGEGEETFYELILALKGEMSIADVNGISYLNQGQLVTNPARVKMKSLADLPLPNREAFPIEEYLQVWKTHHGQSALNISTQRGCPYTCKWCSTAVYGQSYRRRPVEKVVEEIKLLQERYQPDTFWFVDDVFTVSHKWLKEFHAEIKRQQLSIKYECITRAERMNDEVLTWLKESGCFRVWIGAESGSQKVIDLMDRRVKVDQVKNMLIKTKQVGIETGTFIMVGYPGETIEDIELTAQYLVDTLPDHFTITKSYPIRGTQLFDDVSAQLTKEPDWQKTTDREIDFQRAYSDRFYRWAIRYMKNRVLFKKQSLAGSINIKTAIKTLISLVIIQLGARKIV